MNQFLKNLSGRQRLFAFVFLILIVIILLLSFTKDLPTTIAVSIFLCIILLISRPIWLPEDYGKTRVRRYSLWIALAAFSSYGFWNYLFQEKLQAWIKTIFPDIDPSLNIPLAWGYGFLLLVILIVNYFNRDKTALKVHENPIDKDIPDPSFEERLINVVESLVDDLRSIDIKTRWSSTYFTPLDAEVELNKDNGTEKKVMDLLKAVKKSNDRIILVLGDPGAGKSVALRKLAQDLSKETSTTGKIPVYINLKEWIAKTPWSAENPPTVQELNDFVFENLKNRDIVTARFFEKYYVRLYETGRLYFIFDSFDEIPAVLDEKDNSELIQSLSRVLFKFLKGARSKDSRGILSSRIFRRPTDDFQTRTTLFIRPFSEDKIVKTLKRTANEALIKELFVNRTDLVNISRNPFSSSLLVEYIENNPTNPLPKNQASMYSDYIERTFDTCKERIEKRQLTKVQIIECCQLIAREMFKNFGLEVPINHLISKYENQPLKEAIEILVFSRIGRLGTGDNNLFSFVHRRFAEYFVIQEFSKGNIAIDLNVIPTDSQYRDALVLYCEIAEEEEVKKIASFCWKEISKVGHLLDKRAMHSLRFLKDGFKNRVECLVGFHEKFAHFIFSQINRNNNLLSIRLSIEALELLHPSDKDFCLDKVLSFQNYWLTEKALKASRNLSKISEDLTKNLFSTIKDTSISRLVKNYPEYKFNFSLVRPFRQFKIFIDLKLLQYSFKLVIIILVTCSFYPISLAILFFTMLLGFLFQLEENRPNRMERFLRPNIVRPLSGYIQIKRVNIFEILDFYPVTILFLFLFFIGVSTLHGREAPEEFQIIYDELF